MRHKIRAATALLVAAGSLTARASPGPGDQRGRHAGASYAKIMSELADRLEARLARWVRVRDLVS
ncbi:hypothetical protein [Saccharopolyspora phatthalungensis]|uniref:Uncharacterized protein n=1 Tax=Saccharopolyspora phatthalungensis TaxID=664693 RepID=A0A840QG21_9PSEU|nr:hypothetical protein [Saccharopolyspora phatthalungensis]MBB5159794.1 hypothetical protein [Saccharopolyspora phatthalungensis]